MLKSHTAFAKIFSLNAFKRSEDKGDSDVSEEDDSGPGTDEEK